MKKRKTPPRDWDTIIRIAEQKLGVKHGTALKWRERGSVPGKFHLALLDAGRGLLGPSDMIGRRNK